MHACSLRDRCWNCSAPLEPHRLAAEDELITTCATCKEDLRNAAGEPLTTDAIRFQAAGDFAIHNGHQNFLGASLPVSDWFKSARFLATLFRRASNRRNKSLLAFLEKMEVDVSSNFVPKAATGIELLGVTDRQQILGATWRLLNIDRPIFETAIKEAGITQQGLSNKSAAPAIFSDIISRLPDHPTKRMKHSPSHQNRPRSPREVMRKFRKLQHQLEMKR
jgi:hypothetical protein